MEQILNRILEKLDSMESELKNVNNQLDNLEQGQAKLEARMSKLEQGQAKLEQGQHDIKRELRFMWDDIKRLDKRLSKQEEETFILKRMK